jgi:gas vesicle protein
VITDDWAIVARWLSGGSIVTQGNRLLLSALAGAAVGAAAGYLYLTEGGRRMRDQIEPKLDDAMREMSRLRGTVAKVQSVASEGWRSLNQLTGGRQPELGRPRQASPS